MFATGDVRPARRPRRCRNRTALHRTTQPAACLQREIKSFLEKVYDLQVDEVRTINYLGKKKRDKFGFYRRPDWKKAYVFLKPPSSKGASTGPA